MDDPTDEAFAPPVGASLGGYILVAKRKGGGHTGLMYTAQQQDGPGERLALKVFRGLHYRENADREMERLKKLSAAPDHARVGTSCRDVGVSSTRSASWCERHCIPLFRLSVL
jgi:hypothetical protein